jgi:putative membrane protein
MSDIISYWKITPFAALLLLTLPLFYMRLWRYRLSVNVWYFLAAYLVLFVCLASPLQLLSEQYLFSAHMAVHVVLLLVAAPLLVLALPQEQPVALQQVNDQINNRPWLAWLTGVGVMWLWHIPMIFNAAMDHKSLLHNYLHDIEQLSFIGGGMVFVYPVFAGNGKMHPLTTVVYLLSACIFCSLLGLLITFAPLGLYYHYLSSTDSLHLNNIILYEWNISQQDDQQAAGLIMWVPCCMVYILFSLYALRRWFGVQWNGIKKSKAH